VKGTVKPLSALPAQLPTLTTKARMATAAAPLVDLTNAFLTRPYMNYHAVTSVFDHCNPDYSVDGKVCRYDGAVGYRSNGSDPSFSLGYAQSYGGGDYLYYDGHNGWDLALNYENILAAADGTVRIAGIDPINTCFGQNVVIDHPNGFSTRYGHMSAIYVSQGQNVTRGQVLGVSGNTGCSSGPHLHFGVYVSSTWNAIDPWGWQGAAGADPWPYDQGRPLADRRPPEPDPGCAGERERDRRQCGGGGHLVGPGLYGRQLDRELYGDGLTGRRDRERSRGRHDRDRQRPDRRDQLHLQRDRE